MAGSSPTASDTIPPVPEPAEALLFFDLAGARAIAAAAARIFPTDALGPGAAEAGVIHYIDRALNGPARDLQSLYRRGIARLDERARTRGKDGYAAADVATQDAILADLEFEHDPFFATLLTHTREGLFSDPAHGGNREMIGWRLLGHPGVQMAYGPDDYVPGARIARAPRSLADFRSHRAG
ncbi:MAG: gluconate 2-dehydrogenase subunit 3 family protein [Chloroflexi bacterium]|nr:gluconate 2-dehydrogenase subunit 3 family protein [Chloroflexota bacterium]